jgi:hypothetical protein
MRPCSKPMLVAIVSALLLSACSSNETFQTVLGADEVVTVGLPVFLDDLQVGTVVNVGTEGGDRVADISVDMGAARDRMRVGVVRVATDGRIQLKSSGVEAGAPTLAKGARIPTRSAVLDTLISYSSRSTLAALGIAVVGFVLVFFVFRSLVGAVGLIICTVIAGVFTQVVYLHLAPWVLKLYARFPAPEATGLGGPQAQGAPGGTGMVGQAMDSVQQVMLARPDPRMVAWCLVFLAAFIVFNMVLGRVARVWRR